LKIDDGDVFGTFSPHETGELLVPYLLIAGASRELTFVAQRN